jgi:two-component system, NarL family, invasion response regulator UvrY
MDNRPFRIIIADDHAVVRTGLQLILDETTDLSIVDEARDGQELLDKLQFNNYDLVILDIAMPGKDALDVLKEIKTNWSSMPVVIFSMNSNEMYAVRMLSNGASAFINKETKPTQIIEILRIVLSGKRYISPQQAEILVENASIREKSVNTSHELLTDREFQIFCLLANGMRKSEIAEKLEISINTLSNHRNNILKKMKMSINSDLTRYAIHAGIIQ